MSRPRYRWWGYVRNVIRAYPELKKEYELIKAPQLTAKYNCTPSGGGTSDPTHQAAARQLPAQTQREFEAVDAAIRETKQYQNGEQRIEIIRLVYWRHSHTVDGAGEVVGYKSAQARELHGEFVRLVARHLSFI